MEVTVFGKVHKKGTAKTSGKPYNFYELHMAIPTHGVIGKGAKTKIVDATFCDFDKLTFGVYDADFDGDGNLLALKPIQQSAGR